MTIETSPAIVDTPAAEIDRHAEAAREAAVFWRAAAPARRIALLEALADALDADQAALVALADRETRLGAPRLQGELARTTFQLRGFATEIREGRLGAVLDQAAVPGAPPAGRPALTSQPWPVGPVAMFAASNFPFAFSVLGGDTAAALAAGCPVIVKAHPGHPELSRRVGELACAVVQRLALPVGTFALVEGAAVATGVRLVRHPAIAAVAFTGSFKGGIALQAEAQSRPRPIPFFGELGSINPVVALPAALAHDPADAARRLADAILGGCGQFCTSPGIILVLADDPNAPTFVSALADALQAGRPHAMLSATIRDGFEQGVARFERHAGVARLTAPIAGDSPGPAAYLGEASVAAFLADAALHEEVFGPAALLMRVRDIDEAIAVLDAIGGSLTVTLWGASDDSADNRRLSDAAAGMAGRVLFEGVPTGVAVTAAQMHGGPFPASTRPDTTSVGYAAANRFLRPVAWQSAPAWRVSQG